MSRRCMLLPRPDSQIAKAGVRIRCERLSRFDATRVERIRDEC